MGSFTELVGSWAGSNGFQLMPGDSPYLATATAEASSAAKGHLLALAYTWSHPEDGAQDGLLVLGPDAQPDRTIAFWGDSWHQTPEPKVLTGGFEQDGLLVVSYEYAVDWRWQITIDSTNGDSLVLRMDNVVPESAATDDVAAGAYPAMLADLHRRS